MNQLNRSNTPVHPFDILKPEWEVGRQSVCLDRFIVRHDIQPPDELSSPSLSTHILVLQLSHGDRQITHIGDEKYEGSFNSNDFFLLPQKYSAFNAWETTDENILFLVQPNFLTRVAEQTECLNPARIELRPIVIGRDPIVEQIARSFLGEMQTEGLGGRLYSETLATQLAIHLLRQYCAFDIKLKQYNGGLSSRKLQNAIDYIETNLEEKIGLDTLAKITQISPYHFSRLFKQSTGITPYQYVLKQRIELGKQLLRKELPIAEIAMMCGFASQSSFTTAFRKLVGVTPRNYRMNSK